MLYSDALTDKTVNETLQSRNVTCNDLTNMNGFRYFSSILLALINA